MSFLLVLLVLLLDGINGGCPFYQNNKYNFTGDWSYIFENISYTMHLCQLNTSEIYFTISINNSLNNNNHNIVGYGSGNWSASNMAIIGKKVDITGNNSNGYSIFAMGMNQQMHQWWYQDTFKSIPINQITKENNNSLLCGLPYGIDIRKDYWKEYNIALNKYQRKFYKTKIKMRPIMRQQKRDLLQENNKWYNKIRNIDAWKQFLIDTKNDFYGLMGWNINEISKLDELKLKSKKRSKEAEELKALVLKEIGEFTYDVEPEFPTLFGTKWTNGNEYIIFDNDKSSCFMKKNNMDPVNLWNFTIMYDGVGLACMYNNDGNMMFLQTDKDTMISSLAMNDGTTYDIMEWKLYGNVDNNIQCSVVNDRNHVEL